MSALEDQLRAILNEMIRDEVKRVLVESPPDEYLSTREAARIAKVAPATVRRWLNDGKLTKHAAGPRFRVSRRELELLMRRGAANDQMTPEQLADKAFG